VCVAFYKDAASDTTLGTRKPLSNHRLYMRLVIKGRYRMISRT